MNYVADFFFVLLGCVVLLSMEQIFQLAHHRWRGILTTGKVTKLEEQASDEGGFVYIPIVEYSVDEQPWQINSRIAMAPALYRQGQEVPVYYFAHNPSDGRVVTPREFFKWILVMSSILGFFAVLTASSR